METQTVKKSKIEDVGVLRWCALIMDDEHLEWIDAREFSLAGLASEIGVDVASEVKVKVVLEVVQEPCLYCGRITSGEKLCQRCHAVVCDECSKMYMTARYCPPCFNKKENQEPESNACLETFVVGPLYLHSSMLSIATMPRGCQNRISDI